ncbi:MAG: hypothetical protein AAGF56_03105 [Pseudomonadota bacterium]
MSERFDIKAGERGVIRLFTVHLAKADAETFAERDLMTGDWPLSRALGVEDINTDFVDLFAVEDLGELGLTGYMIDGLGIDEAAIDEDRARLETVQGFVLVVLSSAFKGLSVSLLPRAPLRWIGTYFEDRSPVQFEKLPDESAAPQAEASPKKKSDAAMSGRVAMLALLVVSLITGLMIWIAA